MAKQPNIVVFVSHDTGRHIGPYGVTTVRTPNAERLAREGVLFENAFCASPGCCPSRAGLFSGRSPHAVGMLGQAGAWAGFRFSPDATHAAAHFKALGYETMLLGLAHEVAGAGCPDSFFEGIGFDHLQRHDSLPSSTLRTRAAEMLNGRREPGKPFYLQIGTRETHRAYLRDGVEPFDEMGVTIPQSPALCGGPGTRQEFAELQGAVNRLDEGLGYVLDALDARGLAGNTIVVFTTDHGLPMPREKTTLYDRGIGVFLIMRYPGVFAAGARRDELISNVDVLPTLIEAAGGSPAREIEGKSFCPLLTGKAAAPPREMVFAEKTFHTSYDPVRCVRTRRHKYIFSFESVRQENHCLDIYNRPVLMENFGALEHSPHRFDELYDLETDPRETKNLAEEPAYQETRQSLATALVKWMSDTRDPLLSGPVASPRFYDRLGWLKQRLAT